MSTPLRIARLATVPAHAAEVQRLTATNTARGEACTRADLSHGVGGVCNVVTIGTGTTSAIATGRWWVLLLCTTSNRSCAVRISSSIRPW